MRYLPLLLLTLSCNAPSPSAVKVTNGKPVAETAQADKPTILVGNGLYSCTGTFLSPTVVLTAAHCLYVAPGSHAAPTATLLGGEGPTSVRTAYDQMYFELEKQGAGLDKTAVYDVALAFFPPGTAQKLGITTFRSLAAAAPKVGDKVRLLGYGHNDMVKEKGAGLKREGTNEILDMDDELLAIDGTSLPGPGNGVDANLGSGDSGGPLLDQAGRVIGVAIAVGVIKNDRHTGFFINTAGPVSRQLFAANDVPVSPADDGGDGGSGGDPGLPPLPATEQSSNGTCTYTYSFEQTIQNGSTVSHMCYPERVASDCRAGYRCPAPVGLARACPAPDEDRARALACR